jgi:triacylglycerol lipase
MTGRFGSLSPRRRIFAAGLAAVVVVTALVVTVAVLAGQGSSTPAGYPAQNRPGPVLLVPGYGGSTVALSVLAARIRADGRQASVLRLPGNGTGSLTSDAQVLDAAVTRALQQGAPSVDVIGYSAGGVTALLWARNDGGSHKARRVITLGSPFHGAQIAGAAEGFAPDACPLACQQLVPGSSIIASLHGSAPARLHWLSLWTTDDRTVQPPDSARLGGAIDVPIQSICPQQQISHSQLPTNPVATAMVLQAIGSGPVTRPTAADCGT